MRLTAPPLFGDAFDLCVVGAGPCGLSLALEAAELGLRVLVLEAGGGSPRVSGAVLRGSPLATVLEPASHAPVSETTSSAVGGTSWLWGGRCVPFEPVDFEVRDFVPGSGWPITQADVAPWQERAAAHLDCGSAEFHVDPLPGWADTGIETSQRERWSRRPQLARHLGARVLAHERISVLTGAAVTGLSRSADGSAVDHLRVRHGRRTVQMRADQYALACGGLGTTRLMLHLQKAAPELFGGLSGVLGRYYTGHLTGSIATVVLDRPEDVRDWDFQQDDDGTFVRRRFALSQAEQHRRRVLNTAFYLGNLPFADAGHGSGGLSLLYLAMRAPVLGAKLVQRETRRINAGSAPGDLVRHLQNVLRHPVRAVVDVAGLVRLRFLASPRRSVFVLHTERGSYALRYHAEQVPRRENRVLLNGGTAPDGMPGIDIHFGYSGQDVDSVLEAHAVLDERLRASGYGHLEHHHPVERRADAVRSQARDGYHQIGTVRMSADPGEGVVDTDCRVHGLDNLHVASSAVFPTAGEANPTFMAVTLAVRLAHHLAGRQVRPEVGVPGVTGGPTAGPRC